MENVPYTSFCTAETENLTDESITAEPIIVSIAPYPSLPDNVPCTLYTIGHGYIDV